MIRRGKTSRKRKNETWLKSLFPRKSSLKINQRITHVILPTSHWQYREVHISFLTPIFIYYILYSNSKKFTNSPGISSHAHAAMNEFIHRFHLYREAESRSTDLSSGPECVDKHVEHSRTAISAPRYRVDKHIRRRESSVHTHTHTGEREKERKRDCVCVLCGIRAIAADRSENSNETSRG